MSENKQIGISLPNLTLYDQKIKKWVNKNKFIATTSDKLNTIPIISGQLIFSKDNRIIYIDTNERTAFQQIITLLTDESRLNLTSPIDGMFYFVEETGALWNYKNNKWIAISGNSDSMNFLSRDDFPVTGKEKVLYITEDNIYQWNSTKKEYIIMGGGNASVWEELK